MIALIATIQGFFSLRTHKVLLIPFAFTIELEYNTSTALPLEES